MFFPSCSFFACVIGKNMLVQRKRMFPSCFVPKLIHWIFYVCKLDISNLLTFNVSFFVFLQNKEVKHCVAEANIGFMMSPRYHPSMKIVAPVRKSLKAKTIFNIVGPMLNPAQVPFAVVGVYNEDIVSFTWLILFLWVFQIEYPPKMCLLKRVSKS